jgi:hypothetical protein
MPRLSKGQVAAGVRDKSFVLNGVFGASSPSWTRRWQLGPFLKSIVISLDA